MVVDKRAAVGFTYLPAYRYVSPRRRHPSVHLPWESRIPDCSPPPRAGKAPAVCLARQTRLGETQALKWRKMPDR